MSDIKEGTVLTIDSSATLTQSQYLLSLLHLGTLSKCIGLMVELQIANSLLSTENPIAVVDLAKCLQLDEDNLRRVLSFLASFGIVDQLAEGDRFVGTPLSDLLRDDNENSVADMVRFMHSHQLQLAFVDMGYSLETGKPSFEHVNGATLYKYMNDHPGMERTFDSAIARFTKNLHEKMASSYDFSRNSQIVEIAGGRGSLLLKILNRWENVNAVLFERSIVLPNKFAELEMFKNRFRAVEGDALEDVNVEADLFLIANTLFNYDEASGLKILQNIAKAMSKSQKEQRASRLLIVEPEIGNLAPNEPSTMKRSLDLLVMIALGGRIRSEEDFRSFLTSKAGFEVLNTFKLPPFHCAYECKLA